MVDFLNGKDPWFRAKRYGYGSGLPFKWQGWALMLSHVAAIIFVALLFAQKPTAFAAIALILAFVPMPFYAARTEGGWKWRWGKSN